MTKKLCTLLKEIETCAENEISVTRPESIYVHLIKYAKKPQEHFIVLTLNGAHQVIHTHIVTKGLVNRTVVHPREVFRVAIRDNAAAIVIAHNHPSGGTLPSPEDMEITDRLCQAGRVIGIDVLDHIIIGKYGYSSFAEKGIMPKEDKNA